MYGYLSDTKQFVFDCALELQEHIDNLWGQERDDDPQVSVSMNRYAARVEVDSESGSVVIWCSESHGELTKECLIELFTDECGRWSTFYNVAKSR